MNTLRIMRKLCSRFCLKELFLLATLTLMVVFTNIVLEPMETFLNTRRELRSSLSVDFDSTLHFNPSIALTAARNFSEESAYFPEVHEAMRQNSGTAAVLELYQCLASYKEGDITHNFNFILYSKAFDTHIPLHLQETPTAQAEEGYLPVTVSAAMAQALPVGTKCELRLSSEDLRIPCIVTGVASTEHAIPVANTYGQYGSISALGLSQERFGEYEFVTAVYDPAFFGEVAWDYASLIVPKAGMDWEAWRASLQAELSSWGELHSLAEIEDSAFKGVLSEHLTEQLNFFLLALIAVFGYGAYLFLSIRQRERRFAVFYILGMTRKRMFLLSMLLNLSICLLSAAAGWALTPWVARTFVKIEAYRGAGMLGALCTGGILLLTWLLSLAVCFIQSKKETAIAWYHKGD